PPPGGPGGYGAPPGGYGMPDQGYGAPPQQPYGAPTAGAYGAPPGAPPGAALAGPGQFGMGPPGAPRQLAASGRGQTRNPVMTLGLSYVCCFYWLYQMWTMLNELQQYSRDEEFKPFYMFIPFLNYYFLWIKVPEQVAKAKQMAGSRNPQAQSLVLYI